MNLFIYHGHGFTNMQFGHLSAKRGHGETLTTIHFHLLFITFATVSTNEKISREAFLGDR